MVFTYQDMQEFNYFRTNKNSIYGIIFVLIILYILFFFLFSGYHSQLS